MDVKESFWQFSNRIYRNDDVAQSCLHLQDELGADVNLMLFACWYGHCRGRLPDALLQEAVRLSQQWHEACVQPLRQARHRLKQAQPGVPDTMLGRQQALRADIKRLELDAEHFQQDMLQQLASAEDTGADEGGRYIEDNLRHYLATLPAVKTEQGRQAFEEDIRHLLDAVAA